MIYRLVKFQNDLSIGQFGLLPARSFNLENDEQILVSKGFFIN